MPRIRSKRWCFTLNNPTEEESALLDTLLLQMNSSSQEQVNNLRLTYLLFGKETGESGTLHYQGYLESTSKYSLTTVKALLPRAHWEKARGTSLEASEYCKKDGDWKEAGSLMPGQGSRTDLLEIKEAIDNGATETEIADNYFEKWVVYRRSFQAYATLKNLDRAWRTVTHVYWGKTGTGKTRFVMDQIMDSLYWSPGDYKWFDGYCGQPIVIIDDYRGEYPIQLLLKLLDRYAMSVPVKGGFVKWAPKKIYITSNIHPNDWYPTADRFSIAAMFRRIDKLESCFESLY